MSNFEQCLEEKYQCQNLAFLAWKIKKKLHFGADLWGTDVSQRNENCPGVTVIASSCWIELYSSWLCWFLEQDANNKSFLVPKILYTSHVEVLDNRRFQGDYTHTGIKPSYANDFSILELFAENDGSNISKYQLMLHNISPEMRDFFSAYQWT